RLTVRALGEREALRYAAVRASGQEIALSVLSGGLDSAETEAVWDAVIRSRAAVLDEMARRRHTLVGSDDPEIARLEEELSAASRRAANLAFRKPDPQGVASYRKLLAEAVEDKETAERKLAARSLSFRQERALEQAGVAELAGALSEGQAIVAYVRYDEQTPRYLAFVHTGPGSKTMAIPLGGADRIDDLVRRWREQIAAAPYDERRDPAGAETKCRVEGEALRRAIWDPVARQLGDAVQVFVVPDGALHLVSFAALPASPRGYLVEGDRIFHYLSAERDLIGTTSAAEQGVGLLAVGGPAYNSTSPFRGSSVTVAAGPTSPDRLRGVRSSCIDAENLGFTPLAATVQETDRVVALWRSNTQGPDAERFVQLTAEQAGETAFKKEAPGKRVLHVATHGFFLGGPCRATFNGTRGIGGLTAASDEPFPAVLGENPLLLSGLALAGANRREAAGPLEDDGILTAEEVAAMDLTGVSWAVLSACDTGVGELEAGEGVLGLRRAFQTAGAATVIMSLWSVEDEATGRWMDELYSARLKEHLTTAQSVHEATLRLLEDRRERGLSTHPFYWGAFVAAGDWR
ncbi:MAG: CHAT domain-containing protein, partial [Acidobacteriota bacterium]|nr:CHAT domain-containing protein [Acidobacteriota bacterium]